MNNRPALTSLIVCALFVLPACRAADVTQTPSDAAGYLREHIYDTVVRPDEALTNVRVAFNRWPDCTTLESAIHDIFRLEGVEDKTDQDKAFALWKWFRILTSGTGGSYAYELGNPRRPVTDPHKIFTVYGHHQCDGLSWAMVPLWRAAGYMAFDQCHWGHTIASLRYRDRDGKLRFHDFDPQSRFYWWDATNRWVGTWTNPILRAKVHRHLMLPRRIHSLRTSLRRGETIARKWTNEGHIVPSGRDKRKAFQSRYYTYQPGKARGVYAVVGEEVQTLRVGPAGAFARLTCRPPRNVACSIIGQRFSILHPKDAGRAAELVYRMGPPYVVADARVEATLVKGSPTDTCRLLISTDGKKWTPVFEKKTVGEEKVTVDIGVDAWRKKKPNVFTAYTFFVKAEFKTAGDVRSVGMKALKITAIRMLNKRTLPHLRPGENVVKVTADKTEKYLLLALDIEYSVNGKSHRQTRYIGEFPYYFKIDVPTVPERILKNYDKLWNDGALKMVFIRMQLVSAYGHLPSKPDLTAAEGRRKFAISSPHPADMTRRRPVKVPETDVRQTSGFFPQAGPGTKAPDDTMRELIKQLNGGRVQRNLWRQWTAAEDLGDYPAAVDALLAALPRANIDLTLFICKALARNPHRRMIAALLAKWRNAPRGSPGTRYIPDVLAAIGDRSVVPQLVAPLRRCRFDYRFHIAHALGILGGPQARRVLLDLARNDPSRPVREEARHALRRLDGSK